ncbi:hypothetical protein C8R45DRAFT_1104117 [Mycena sanguinolenta]|nr:hypothetical protein C8R45DRAFT_1104117 [Mycena sanguinolenta]
MASSFTVGTALGTAIGCLSVATNVFNGVPFVGPVLSLASGILTTIQRVCDNSKALQQLGDHIQDLIAVVKPVESLSAEMEKSLEHLFPILLEINDFVKKRRSPRTRFRRARALTGLLDESKINEYRAQIRRELELFGVKAVIGLDQKLDKVIQISKQHGGSDVFRRGRTKPLQIPTQQNNSDIGPAPPEEAMRNSDTSPAAVTPAVVIPDDLLKHVDNNPRLLSILGVAAVFCQRPSVLQISRVLEIEVQAALETISPYLPGRDSAIEWNSDLELPQSLKDSLLQSTGVSAKYHGLVAKWCLVGQRGILDPKDIFYSCDFWEYHVCNADLSTDLFTALRHSPKPLDPGSRDKLPEVIQWIEQNGGPADLVSAYSEANKKPPEPVYIMGGMSSFLL